MGVLARAARIGYVSPMLHALLLIGACLAAPPPTFYADVNAATIEVLVDDHLNGSGFIVGADGTAVTAAHVVPDPSRRVEIRSPTLGRIRVGVKATDRGSDVALLRLPRRDEPYPALEMSHATPTPAQSLWLFGTPIYRHRVMLHGRVARDTVTYEYLPDRQLYLRIFHLSAPSPPGTSGGPWVDESGKVVGLQSGLMHDSGSPVGIAYMVPNDAINALIASGRDADTATIGLGLEELWEQGADTLRQYPPRTEGLYIARLRDDGPGAKAGLEQGMVITHLDGVAVSLRDELVGRIRARKPGDTVKVRVIKTGTTPREVEVKLARLESLR